MTNSVTIEVDLVMVLFAFASLLLLVYLATKASGLVIKIVLGVGMFLLLGWFLSKPSGPLPGWTSYPPLSQLPNALSPSNLAVPNNNQKLWDRLTKSRIELGEEKTASEDENLTESTPSKPNWLKKPPKRTGNVTRRVVSSDPYSTVEECLPPLEQKLRNAVRERLQTLIANEAGSSVLTPNLGSFGTELDPLLREICREEFAEPVSSSVGKMWRVHVLMEFTPAVEKQLRIAWKKQERRHRLGLIGKIAALTLGLLAGIYGLLKFDAWTRGVYAKRLLLGVPLAIIVLVVFLSL